MEETAVVVTVKELVLRAQPLTATSSLKSKLNSPNQKPQSQSPPSTNPNLKILTPLKHSVNLLGTLTLPTETLKCPIRNCFRFSDDSSTICCDILDFRVNIIGKRIRVLACNFIPLKHFCGGGFLEIIKWSFVDSTSSVISSSSSSLDLFPLVSSSPSNEEDQSKARYRVNGPIESISPVFIVPCSIGDSKSQNLRGFVARIMVCQCKICNSTDSIKFSHSLGQGNDSHSFTKPSFVYFCGASWCWHPVITKLIGIVIMLSGLKKKLVFIGKEESQLMFVTTEYSGLQLPRVLKKWPLFSRNVIRGNGECGVYTGVVRGVYMQGMVVELDKEVWLLLTDQQVTAPHSLREGAIISARNVHFVNPKFSWTKMLVLGACFKTSITVESFSPLETGCHMVAQSQNQLGKFIESLTFSARLWTLLVISCFRKKFTGILSEKEILGSKHKEGLVQMFARSHLPASIFRARLGVLSELCRHESCGCGSEPYHGNLKLVAPISILLSHCENMWTRTVSKDCHASQEKPPFNFPSHEMMSYCLPSRRSFSSEDIGILLLGSLKISPSSGRLQLVDATGSIDVLIPDLPSTWRTTNIYEVVDYSLIMEGMPKVVDRLGLLNNESLSCSHIFHYVPRAIEMNLAIYSYFHLSSVTCKNLCFYPSVPFNEDLQELQSGIFHLIWISHKYPLLQQLQGDPVIPNRANVFVEAVVLPWDLSIAGMDPIAHSSDISRIWLNKASRHLVGKNHGEYIPNKRCKMDCMPGQDFVSVLVDDHSYVGSELSAYSGSLRESTKWKCGETSCPEIQCLAITRNANSHNMVSSGKLCCTNCKVKIGADYKPSGRKVLLEFSSDSLFIYQSLQIGGYYIIKHHEEESFCSLKDYNNIGGGKICVSSRICPWSLSFSSDDVTNDKSLHDAPPGDSSLSNEEVLMKNQVELLLRKVYWKFSRMLRCSASSLRQYNASFWTEA
uniref:CST complex subunit CTC1 n=1 Tax=Salix viminalis TaxID=40686 RepID=A0A6N2MFT6_SALVM